MKNRERLNPSKALRKNKTIYNTFAHDPKKTEKLLNYLEMIYEKYANDPTPTSAIDRIKKIAQLTDDKLIYLMVEIQIMIIEKSCFPFEKREPGCLSAFFNAYSLALSNIDSPMFDLNSSHLDLTLHRVNTDVNKVQMARIKNDSSGHYRTKNETLLRLPFDQVSKAGIEHLINLMDENGKEKNSGRLSSMFISCYSDYKTFQNKSTYLLAMEHQDVLTTLLIQEKLSECQFTQNLFQTISPALPKQFSIDSEIMDYIIQVKNKLIVQLRGFFLTRGNSINKNIIFDIMADLNSDQALESVESMLTAMRHAGTILNKANEFDNFKKYLNVIIQNKHEELEDIKTRIITSHTLSINKKKYHANSTKALAEAFYKKLLVNKEILVIKFANGAQIARLMKELKHECSSIHINAMKNKSWDEKLYFIYEHIQLMLLVHPFRDANNRTYVNEVAPLLHLKLGIDIPIYYNPFVFYAHSLSEVVETVKLAIANFYALHEIEQGNNPGFNLHQTLTNNQLKKITDFVKPFRLFIDKLFAQENIDYIEGEFKSYLLHEKTKNSNIKLFPSPSPDQVTLDNDLTIIKAFSNSKNIFDFLEKKSKTYQEKSSQTNLANLYDDILAFLYVSRLYFMNG